MNYDYKNLKPFKWFVLQNFPFIEADFDAITNWQLFCKLGEEINKVINSMNLTGQQVESLTNAFNSLESYVNNYFENLDIQEEVNEKLDEMAQSGQLAELISQYLESQAIIGFNTNTDLKNATNLANGSFARTYGKDTYNDGKGAFYKIRTRTNADVPDDDNIIALVNTENLVAEKMPDFNLNQLQLNINSVDNKILEDIVVIGDSYTSFSNSTWAEELASQLHLTLHKNATSSMGYAHAVNNKVFSDLLDFSNTSFYNKVKYVICYGGINDYDKTRAEIETGVESFIQKAKTNFPNAQIILVGPQTGAVSYKSRRITKEKTAIERKALSNGVCFVDSTYWLINTSYNYTNTYDSDRLHPSALGYKIITSKMLGIINNICYNNTQLKLSLNSNYTGVLKTSFEKSHVHFIAKITGTFTKGAYNVIIKIEDLLGDNIDFAAFSNKDSYFPAYKIDSNNNVNAFCGCARISNSSATGEYGLYLVPIIDTFTGTIAIEGDIYMNWIDENSSEN